MQPNQLKSNNYFDLLGVFVFGCISIIQHNNCYKQHHTINLFIILLRLTFVSDFFRPFPLSATNIHALYVCSVDCVCEYVWVCVRGKWDEPAMNRTKQDPIRRLWKESILGFVCRLDPNLARSLVARWKMCSVSCEQCQPSNIIKSVRVFAIFLSTRAQFTLNCLFVLFGFHSSLGFFHHFS